MKYPNFPGKPIVVTDIYKSADPELPSGYEATGEFRPVKITDEAYLGNVSFPFAYKPAINRQYLGDAPRIILRTRPKRKVRTFTHTGQKRAIQPGEWYYYPTFDMYYCNNTSRTLGGEYEIVIRTESEV